MFKTILIPLDGSKLAEAALPAAVAIAKNAHAEGKLVLMRVAPDLWLDDAVTPDQLEEFQAKVWHDCQKYLDEVAGDLRKDDLDVVTRVASGDRADQILAAAQTAHAHLIAMATHGRSGLPRLMLGSVADKVVHRATMPVLLIHPDGITGAEA